MTDILNCNSTPDIQHLLDEVESKYGHSISTSKDFYALSAALRTEGHDSLSSSTLKRLWGYVSLHTHPRVSSLNILARYLGFESYNDWRISLIGKTTVSSSFLDSECLTADVIPDGASVTIGWKPDRLITLRKVEGCLFEVAESLNSKLLPGDRFRCTHFSKGLPLMVPAVERNSKLLPSYVAGKADGLSTIKLHKVNG